MMPRYGCVVGASWGERVFERVVRAPETWHIFGSCDVYIGYPLRYLFFLNYSRKVPTRILNQFECVNFHCTALPYGRGGHPIENMILRGHGVTVITAHRMTDEVDAGPIYAVSDPIGLHGTKMQICERFIVPVVQMIRWVVRHEPEPTPQVGEPTYFKRLSPDDYQRFWEARG